MPPPQQQQPPPDQDGQLALAVTTVLATAVTVDAAVAALSVAFIAAGVTRRALAGALTVIMSFPPDMAGAHGPATLAIARLNQVRRAQFAVASARRIQAALAAARSSDQSQVQALLDALSRERRYYGQHLQAIWNRAGAAARTDSAAMMYGDVLGWNAMMDSRTSRECAAADGRNFWASQMPLIGYPGMVHPHCRCWPSMAHPGAAFLPTAAGRRRLVAA